MKVLIAVDFSPIGIAVAEHGYLMAKKSGMDAVFFHCAPRVTHMLLGYAGCGAYAALDDAVEQEKIAPPPIELTLNFYGPAEPVQVSRAVKDAARTVQRSFAEQMEEFQRERGRVAFE